MLLVSSENTAELMSMMVNDKELRKSLGNNACKWVKDYTWSYISKEFDKILVAGWEILIWQKEKLKLIIDSYQ